MELAGSRPLSAWPGVLGDVSRHARNGRSEASYRGAGGGETRESTQGLQLDRYLIVQLGVCEAVGLENVFA